MPRNSRTILFLKSGCTVTGLWLLAVAPAAGQNTGAKKPPPASFSSKPAAKAAASRKQVPMEEPDVADAIMGAALGGMFHRADEHYEKGEWNHTLNLYRIVEQGDPKNVETYSNSAMLLWSSDRGDQAIEQLKAGIAAVPNESYMYDEMGVHYWIRLRDAATAVPYFEKAIKYKCGWTTYHNLANCYQKLGKWDKAVATWKEATKFGDDVRAPALLKQAEAHLAAQGAH